MFNLGSKEILIIALIILFLFGSKKLTEWAKGLGDAGRELKKAKKEFTNAVDETSEDLKKTMHETEKNINRTFDFSEKVEKADKLPEVQKLEDQQTKDKNEQS